MALIDLEVFESDRGLRYLGLFRPGAAGSRVAGELSLGELLARDRTMREAGMGLIDVEVLTRADEPSDDSSAPGDAADGGPEPLAQPAWVDFTGQAQVVVDFSVGAEGDFRIALPRRFLDALPEIGGESVAPDRPCGVRVIRPRRFDWIEDAAPLFDDPRFALVPRDDPRTRVRVDTDAGRRGNGRDRIGMATFGPGSLTEPFDEHRPHVRPPPWCRIAASSARRSPRGHAADR